MLLLACEGECCSLMFSTFYSSFVYSTVITVGFAFSPGDEQEPHLFGPTVTPPVLSTEYKIDTTNTIMQFVKESFQLFSPPPPITTIHVRFYQ